MELKRHKHHSLLPPSNPIKCNHDRYDFCLFNGPILVDPNISTVFFMDSTGSLPPLKENVRPYPVKPGGSMSYVSELTLLVSPPARKHQCDHQHEAPVIVISGGGYTGNFFHEFIDGLIPLFLTVLTFFHNHNPILAIVDCQDWWLNKYGDLIRLITPHPIINLDKEKSTHCFPSGTLGVINHNHGEVNIEPKLLPNFETMSNFRALLGKAFGRNTTHFPHASLQRPRLVIINRTGNASRILLNVNEVQKVAEEVGFEVIVYQPNRSTSLNETSELMNTSHAMFGVQGAGLTNSLFLRPGSVFIQVVPIGLDSLAERFGKLAKELGLEYIEYYVQAKESSLNFRRGTNICMSCQDVRLDLGLVKKFLEAAYVKAMNFMNEEG